MGKILGLEELQQIIGTHRERIGRCVWPSWARYEANIPESDRLTFDLSAEAKILNRFVLDNVKREFAGVPGVEFTERFDWLGLDGFQFGIDGSVVCRFKKLNSAGHSRNFPTPRAQAILRNDEEVLAGIAPSATIVDIGPVINDFRTGFTEVQAIRVVDTKYIMNFPQSGMSGSMPYTLPFTPQSGGGTPRFEIVARDEQNGPAEE